MFRRFFFVIVSIFTILPSIHAVETTLDAMSFDMRHAPIPNMRRCELSLPFASEPTLNRSYHDAKRHWGEVLDIADRFTLTFDCDHPEAIGSVTLYFHSGEGWYGNSQPKPRPLTGENERKLFRITFSKKDFRTEEKPSSWSQSDSLRIAFWRGKAVDATVRIRLLEVACSPSTVLVLSDPHDKKSAEGFAKRLGSLGLETAIYSQDKLPADLNRYRITVLPLNGNLPTETVDPLVKFIENGGKLIAFYQLPKPLMEALGFARGTYLKSPEGNAALAEIRFTPGDKEFSSLKPLPQKSWNIVAAKPLPESPFHAKIDAWWYDAAGRKTEYPAFLRSDRGAFFSHILTDEGRTEKNEFLLTLFGHFDPNIERDAAYGAWNALFDVGDPRNRTETDRQALEKRFVEILAKDGFAITPEVFPKTGTGKFDRYRDLAKRLVALREEESIRYCSSIKPKSPEFRAWWEHAGTGAHPGDWDRTMKELKGAGYNAVIPNMLWGGVAHCESVVLPESEKFRRYGDQIAQCVAAGKKHGVQVHVWKVCYNLSNASKEFVAKMRDTGRTQVKSNGETVDWLCPSHPDNVKLECDSLCEVASKYEIDGIHFDYIRYPGSDHCFCNGCRDRFVADTKSAVTAWPADVLKKGPLQTAFDQWRCDQITRLVQRVHTEAKRIKPSIKISAAVFSDYPSCREWVLQDWSLWIEKGYLDFVCPMNYTSSLDRFEELCRSQRELIKGRIPHYPGIGATATGLGLAPDEVVAQIEIARKVGAEGFTIFNLSAGTIRAIPPATKLGATKP